MHAETMASLVVQNECVSARDWGSRATITSRLCLPYARFNGMKIAITAQKPLFARYLRSTEFRFAKKGLDNWFEF